ncbi:MAG: F0F1 ATP synthase subunit delta [Planctomycetes bacterium]|nr:F0F1 ATP synthase subunit delta [Planctomycetota bacterium]
MTVEEDHDLLAGIVVRIGDIVYDCSARGKLRRLTARLSA